MFFLMVVGLRKNRIAGLDSPAISKPGPDSRIAGYIYIIAYIYIYIIAYIYTRIAG